MSAYNSLFNFVDYVWSFYGNEDPLYPITGLTKKHIFDAIFIYREKLVNAEKNGEDWYTWGDGDSLDRERVRDIILDDLGLSLAEDDKQPIKSLNFR